MPLTFTTFGSQFNVGVSLSVWEGCASDVELELDVDIWDMKEDQLGGSRGVTSRRVENEDLISGSYSP